MSTTLIWDLPTRLFHWIFVFGFAFAAFGGLVLGEHHPLFPYHAITGLTLGLLVILRIMWGFIGPRYARFGSFLYSPAAVISYFKGALTRSDQRHIGHNPGSAYAIFLMLILLLVIVVTGVMMGLRIRGIKEFHELATYALLAVAVVHMLGVLFHTLRHRENITASMIHGLKAAPPEAGISSARPLAAFIALVLAALLAVGLARNLDTSTMVTRVPLLGTALKIGDAPRNDSRRRAEPSVPADQSRSSQPAEPDND